MQEELNEYNHSGTKPNTSSSSGQLKPEYKSGDVISNTFQFK